MKMKTEKNPEGFYLTKEAYEQALRIKLSLNDDCDYCKSIDSATKKSPRKKYKYCPMCGKKRGIQCLNAKQS